MSKNQERVENLESTDVTNNSPSEENLQTRELPNLEEWMNEIEEFVAEITHDLNQIGASLGDHSLARQNRFSKNESSEKPKTPLESTTQPTSSDSSDRLGSLKRRLAGLKAPIAPANREGDSNWSEGTTVDG